MKRLFCALILGTFMGCETPEPCDQCTPKDPSTWVVCVGMENSQFAGQCPGAEYDCKRMVRLLGQYTTNINSFISSQATYAKVKPALIRAAENADLFIFYYSGHGGAVKTGNVKESDGQDEFLCLWDREMMDDDLWSIISKAKGRVMLIFDCCHSATMYRVPAPITLKHAIPLQATHNVDGALSLMVFSGCPDDTYSYGDSNGGKLTNTLLKYYSKSITYDWLWDRIESDKDLMRYEKVQRTLMGNRFGSRPVFR